MEPPPRLHGPQNKPKSKLNMPGILSVNTSPSSQRTQTSNSQNQYTPSQPNSSRNSSPTRPPVSPITPTLSNARLATSPNAQPQRRTYTHSQPRQTSVPQPKPTSIAFDENPDALALKSAMAILQLQARNAAADIRTLSAIKERALKEPEEFAKALRAGELTTKSDGLFDFSKEDDDDDDDKGESTQDGKSDGMANPKAWPKLPRPQNVVRAPPINWNQYAVVGESLDKLHADQQARPTEGMPQLIGPDGSLSFGGEGVRRAIDLGIAAPYQPGRDNIRKVETMEKMSTRKGGKR